MSVDIAIWVGEQPASDEAAVEQFRLRYTDRSPLPPAPELTAFVQTLLQRWPEDEDEDEDGEEEQVWGEGPVLSIIRGSFFHTVVLTTQAADDLLAYIIDEAPRHGLVAFDPQRGGLLR